MFKVTRIFNNQNNDSEFEELTIPLKNAGPIGFLSEEIPVKGIVFREVNPSYDYDFHNAPQRQYVVLLDGEIEIETSTGEKRVFKTGDVILADDLEGKGHRTKNIIPARRKSLFVLL
ncbi:MAG: hypothetical protein JXB00_16840 [Bacteroidales bacterium]|nr:hypothetical protein [Bacteroidales bacterium]